MARKVLEAVVRVRNDAKFLGESEAILLRQAIALLIFTAILFVPMCAAHADRGNSQGLTDEDPGFVQDACPPGIVTYYYDEHVSEWRIDCAPPAIREKLESFRGE